MKVKMLNTLSLANVYGEDKKRWTWHKGHIYNAVEAFNQPDYKEKGLVFVSKKQDVTVLLIGKEDYVVVE